ncbi:MAG: hypothetical protein GY820_18275 [Gammaproteobacteria bacterium]|nr:hypothetical protein [Gammaproteobacteria bacterium]
MGGVCLANTAQSSGIFRQTAYSVCFTPGGQCTNQIVQVINSAKHSINIQAYGFTSSAIAKALIASKKRGVKIFVLLDKSSRVGPHGTDPLTPRYVRCRIPRFQTGV